MKRILIILILIGSFSAFSQTEIWGVKQFNGAYGGGYLFSVDSASKKINIQHRFTHSYFYDRDTDISNPKMHEQSASLIGIIDSWLVKFNEHNSRIDYKYLDYKAFGEFLEISDSLWLVLKNGGVYKLNPYNLQIHSIDGFDLVFTTNDIGMTQFDEQYLFWNQLIGAYGGAICMLNLQNNEISKVFDFDSNDEANYFPVGKLIKHDNKLYGVSYKQKQGERSTIIYSYDPSNRQFKVELNLENRHLSRSKVHGLTLYNGRFYSIGKIKPNDKNDYLFSYNPINRTIDTITILEDEIGEEPNISFQIGTEDRLYLSCKKGGEFDNGSIFYVDLNTRQLHLVYSFPQSTQAMNNKAWPFCISNKNIYLFNLTIDSTLVFNVQKINIESEELETYNDHSFIVSSNNGSYPYQIIQTPTAKIVGNTLHGGYFGNSQFGNGTIYQFDPLTKEYSVLHRFTDIDYRYSPSYINLLNGHLLFGIIESNNQYRNSGKYLFNLKSNEYTRLNDFPWQNAIVSSEMISDSNICLIINDNGRPPFQIINYNVFDDSFDTLMSYSEEVTVSNLEVYKDSLLLYQKIIEIDEDNDSSMVMSYNLYNSEVNLFLDLNQFDKTDNRKERFWFNIMPDNSLAGTFQNNIRLNNKQGTDYWNYRVANYKPETDFMKIAGNGNLYYESSYLNYYTYKVMESDENVFYAFNEMGTDWDPGEFKKIDFKTNEMHHMENMEPDQYGSNRILDFGELEIQNLIRINSKVKQIRWTGLISSNWYDKENWLGKELPDSTDIIVIPALVRHTPVIDTLVRCKQIVISDHGILEINPNGCLSISDEIFNNGSIRLLGIDSSRASFIHHNEFKINKSTSYEYYSDTNVKGLVANPMETEGFRFSDFAEIYSFSEEGMEWNPVQNFPFYPEPEKAYLYDQEIRSLSFNGEVNLKDYQIEIPFSSEIRMFPIPNPYTASLNWNQLDLTKLENKALYRFNMQDSTFTSYIDGLGLDSPFIHPLDVVWVYSNGNETINLRSSDRFHYGFKDFDIEEPRNELKISAVGKGGKDQTIISFNQLAGSEFDGKYDAVKPILKKSDRPSIFTKTSEEVLSINQLPDTAMMELYMEAGERGNYTISIDKNKGFDFVVLEDLIWNRRIDLLQQDYRFEYFESDGHYPFKLYFNQWGLEPVAEGDIQIYYYPESIYVRSNKQIEFAQILFYDLAGRVVLEYNVRDFHYFEKQVSLVGGHYIVQLRSGDLVMNRMIWIRE